MLLKDKVKLIVTAHSKQRMRERGISFEEILEALQEPVQLAYDKDKDVYIAVAHKGYAVVYAFHGNVVEIVTVLGKKEYEALMSKHGVKRYKVIE